MFNMLFISCCTYISDGCLITCQQSSLLIANKSCQLTYKCGMFVIRSGSVNYDRPNAHK